MKKLLMIALVVVVGVGGWRWARHDAGNLVVNRIWIDHLPRGDRDIVQTVILLDDESLGLFGGSSQWRGAFELFRYEQHGGEVRAVYPQTGERETIRAHATRCSEGAMDFCLELEGASRGVRRYYSQEGWEIEGRPAEAKARVEAILAKAR